MEVTFTDAQALALVVLTAVLAVVAIACPFRWTLAAVGVGALGFAGAVRTLSGVLAALFVGLLASLVGTIVKERRDVAANALSARVQSEMQAALARDLHDVLAHSLSGLAIQLERSRLVAERDGQVDLAADLASAHGLARRGIEEARVAVAALRGDPVAGGSLGALADEHAALTGTRPRLTEAGDPEPVPVRVRLAVHRVVQEGLTNARRHGAPGEPVGVDVSWVGPVTVTVWSTLSAGDPGAGGSGSPGGSGGSGGSGGYGLAGLRERVALLGGAFDAGPRDDGRWRVEAVFP